MKRTYHFKSLLMMRDPSGEPGRISYDMESARDHIMKFSLARFFLCRSWIPGFFITLMALILVFGIVYGVLVVGMKIEIFGAGSGRAGKIYVLTMTVSFLALWAALGVPAAFRRLKMDFVVKERGKGGWKIVDGDQWDRFCRLLKVERDRVEKLKLSQ
jgi:hypothetical protein